VAPMKISVSLGVLGGLSQGERGPLKRAHEYVLTESWRYDSMNRRAGGIDAHRMVAHGDSHKHCQIGCGRSSRDATGQTRGRFASKDVYVQRKITAWRKARAAANRAYLEENVYGRHSQGNELV